MIESFARNFTTKSVRKNILKTPEKNLKKNVSNIKISKIQSPKKLTEKEKAILLEVFTLSNEKIKSNNSHSNTNLIKTRSKSPLITKNANLEYFIIDMKL